MLVAAFAAVAANDVLDQFVAEHLGGQPVEERPVPYGSMPPTSGDLRDSPAHWIVPPEATAPIFAEQLPKLEDIPHDARVILALLPVADEIRQVGGDPNKRGPVRIKPKLNRPRLCVAGESPGTDPCVVQRYPGEHLDARPGVDPAPTATTKEIILPRVDTNIPPQHYVTGGWVDTPPGHTALSWPNVADLPIQAEPPLANMTKVEQLVGYLQTLPREHLVAGFEAADTDGNGGVSMSELKGFMGQLLPDAGLSDADLTAAIKLADLNKSGDVTFDELEVALAAIP